MIKSMMNPLRTLMNVEELLKGWSVGQALELRDGDKGRLLGKGVFKARKVSKPWDGRIFLGPFAMKQGEALTFEEWRDLVNCWVWGYNCSYWFIKQLTVTSN